MEQRADYNARLFAGSALRRSYHTSRFEWFRDNVSTAAMGPLRIVELGCFDARTIDYIAAPLERYVGLDANWEGGLTLGRERFKDRHEITFIETRSPSSLSAYADGAFNVAVALETLEHLPPPVAREYVTQLARITDGMLIVSVPNELGPVFLLKYVLKRVLGFRDSYTYNIREVIAATCFNSRSIERDEHKGFSYFDLIEEISNHFDIFAVEGVDPRAFPPVLSLTVGILARTRPKHT